MSLFSQILDKLGLKKDKAGAATTPSTGTSAATKPSSTGQAADPQKNQPAMPGSRPGAVANPAASGPANPNLIPQTGAAAATPMSEVDVVHKLETLGTGKNLNWKTSIVDLLKLLDLDSSREARTELAKELNAPADVMNDSARMNTWLHKEVLRRIAANGGNIPKDLLN
jgi:hypothetical protein